MLFNAVAFMKEQMIE